jgi:cytochrome c oxidase subunit 2
MRCAALLALAGCEGPQSALDPKGPGATEIGSLFWVFTVICGVAWVLVVIALAAALVRRRSLREQLADPLLVDGRRDVRLMRVAVAATVLTGVVLIALTASSYFTGKSLAHLATPDEMTVRVNGHQWWWEIRYEAGQPDRVLSTANEIVIPVGKTVRLKLASSDVIHSFWVPNLSGKHDLIPGRESELRLSADEPGAYRAQCAEFCGLQHAHMSLLVIALPKADFDAWMESQLAPARAPSDADRQAGQTVLLSTACVMCHTVRGTNAGGKVGPDLTHLASRRTIAAGTLPMSRGNLAAWIADPQSIKPGSNMPRVDLDPDQLNALVAYLEGLK